MMMKKVAIIGTAGIPANEGRFEILAGHMIKNLNQKFDFTVYCSSKKDLRKKRKASFLGARLIHWPLGAHGIVGSIYDAISILHALIYADVLLIFGLSGAWLIPFVRLLTTKKIIVSMDGIEWKKSRRGGLVRFYLKLAERQAIKYSHIDLSDNEAIQDYTAIHYGSLSRMIECGGDHVQMIESTNKDHEQFHFLKYIYAISMASIEPQNNTHLIMEAFCEVKNRHLVMIGDWNGSEYGRKLRKKYASVPTFFLLDPITDQRTLDLLRSNALMYIHGSNDSGTHLALVEAMSYGLPVLSYNISGNRNTTEDKAMYFSTGEELRHIVFNTRMEQLRDVSVRMKEIAERRYAWSTIACKYDVLICEALISKPKDVVKALISRSLSADVLQHYQVAHLKNQYLFFE